MTLAEKIFALHGVSPFNQLQTEELFILASAMTPRTYAKDRVICPAGETMQRLYVCIEGSMISAVGGVMQPVVGTTCLLAGQPSPFEIRAGENGCRALVLARGKFFTAINECPSLLTGFLQMPLLGVDYVNRCGEDKP